MRPPQTRANDQFSESDAQTLSVTNDGLFPSKVFARFQFPNDPENRNYGFMQSIKPGQTLVYQLPAGTAIYACDGRYWDDYRPNERLVGVLTAGQSIAFTAGEFRP